MKTQLWDHQKGIVNFMLERTYGLIAAGMRTGKTLATYKYIELTGYKTLIITTKKGIEVWENEHHEHVGDQKIVSLGQNSTAAKVKTLNANPDADIVVINYESFWRGDIINRLIHFGFDAVVSDEGHYLKGNNTKVSKIAYQLGKYIPNRFILTGTPLPNSPLDIFGQARFLNEYLFTFDGVRYLKAFGKFQARYANLYDVAPNVKAVSSYKNLGELNEEMQKFTYRVDSAEVFDLPGATHTQHYVSLSAGAQGIYKSFANELILEMDQGIVTADNVLVKSIKLQQIAGGWLRDDDGFQHDIHTDKITKLLDIIEHGIPKNEPIVVFARFSAEVWGIRDALLNHNWTVSVLDGHANQLAAWQNGETKIIVVQIDTGAEAISLVRASHAIYYSVTYSLGKFEQSLMRISGPKQLAPKLQYHYIIATRTIDEDVYAALQSKTNVKNRIMKTIRGYKRL